MEQLELQRYVVGVLERLRIDYFVTGSLATILYGEPRFTNDIDIVADIRPEHIVPLLESFPAEEFYLSEDAIRHAIRFRSQVNILHPTSGMKVDLMIPEESEHDRSRFARRRKLHVAPDFEAYYTSPEDVILKKMKYYSDGESEKHLRDIAGMLKIMGNDIDRAYISDWSSRLGLSGVWELFAKHT
jgi:hypothetical protein